MGVVSEQAHLVRGVLTRVQLPSPPPLFIGDCMSELAKTVRVLGIITGILTLLLSYKGFKFEAGLTAVLTYWYCAFYLKWGK